LTVSVNPAPPGTTLAGTRGILTIGDEVDCDHIVALTQKSRKEKQMDLMANTSKARARKAIPRKNRCSANGGYDA